MKHVIDAKNKKIGRVCSQVAMILMGKNAPTYERNKIPVVEVEIINTSKADISNTKKDEKTYRTYSGYPGGQKNEKLADLATRKGHSELFKRAVYGMLPSNKLRSKMMLNLKISE
ncbi:MAG: uL13 family ribosomal protein [bacterium]